PPTPAPRWRPTASISSTNTIAGAAALACSNRSRTRDAPTPTNISTKAGRPGEKDAFGELGAHLAEPGGVFEELLDLAQLRDGLVESGDVRERDGGLGALGGRARCLLPPP